MPDRDGRCETGALSCETQLSWVMILPLSWVSQEHARRSLPSRCLTGCSPMDAGIRIGERGGGKRGGGRGGYLGGYLERGYPMRKQRTSFRRTGSVGWHPAGQMSGVFHSRARRLLIAGTQLVTQREKGDEQQENGRKRSVAGSQ